MSITWKRRTPALVLGAALLSTAAMGPALPTSSALGTQTPAPPTSSPTGTSSTFLDEDWGNDETGEDEKASKETGRWQAKDDLGSLYTSSRSYGAQGAWGDTDRRGLKTTGRGVDVAVIDTGIAPVAGLNAPGKVVNGPDLSFESQHADTRHLDGYGHGTHMAGIIAGRDTIVAAGKEKNDDHFVGMAPDARIVNVKVGTADGGADVSQIIAAIDWVVQHRNDSGLNIRVINLSYGTRSTQSYTIDPLSYAVENAWRKGVVVVVAAGNDGAGHGLTMPAANPYAIAVGAVDHLGTSKLKDDATAAFTNSGTATRRPDLLAPGKSVVSLRTPGSLSDRGNPQALVTGDSKRRLFRGSGTSQATAMVSGAVALLLQQRPDLTPDQVKFVLKTTADPVLGDDPTAGSGVLNIKAAFKADTPTAAKAKQTWAAATGTGTLEAARGDNHVVDPVTGSRLTGEIDAMGNPWEARSWRSAAAAGTAWTGGTWNGRTWSGSDWSGDSWTARSWRSATWTANSWAGGDWQARSWRGDAWTSKGWTSLDTASRSWSQDAWNARSWRNGDWVANSAW